MEKKVIRLENCEICVEERKSKGGNTYQVVCAYTEFGCLDLCFFDRHIENKILRLMLGL